MHLLQGKNSPQKRRSVFRARSARTCAWLQSASPPIRLELPARARSCSPLPSPSPALSIPLWLTGLIPINPPRNNFPAIDRLTSAILRQEKTVLLGKRKDIKKLSNLLLAPLPFPYLPPSSDEASAKLPGRMGPSLPSPLGHAHITSAKFLDFCSFPIGRNQQLTPQHPSLCVLLGYLSPCVDIISACPISSVREVRSFKSDTISFCVFFSFFLRCSERDAPPRVQPERLQHQGGRRRLLRVRRQVQSQALQDHLETQRESCIYPPRDLCTCAKYFA